MGTVIRRTMHLAMVGAAMSLLLPFVAQACGDKLVVLGGGVPFERVQKSRHPGKVVLYVQPDSKLRTANERYRLGAALTQAGHTVTLVENRADLDRTLQQAGADLVLVDWTDAMMMRSELAATPSAPSVLSVLYEPTKAELATAQEELNCVAEASKRKSRYIMRTVEEMLETRGKGLPLNCERTPAPTHT